MTDVGLKELAGLTNLTSLDLSNTLVTKAGLKELQLALPKCLILCPSVPSWADDAEVKSVEFVEKLGGKVIRDPRLPGNPVIHVQLYGKQVTDAGLKELAGLTKLTELSLFDVQVTDVGLMELAGLKNLISLNLGSTQVTDAGLKELAGLKNLNLLFLHNTKVTDAGLKELAGLTNLTSLGVNGTKVTDAGLKELKLALPKCRAINRSEL